MASYKNREVYVYAKGTNRVVVKVRTPSTSLEQQMISSFRSFEGNNHILKGFPQDEADKLPSLSDVLFLEPCDYDLAGFIQPQSNGNGDEPTIWGLYAFLISAVAWLHEHSVAHAISILRMCLSSYPRTPFQHSTWQTLATVKSFTTDSLSEARGLLWAASRQNIPSKDFQPMYM
ncbi:hypothetical protein BT63DRAFT_459724 [Microthyrium microscopicum]|uniref:Uncharacterized protein n=1 Tax=Microthyrium microscopicum TaxID=703497 RepID=A0A6A6U2D0_9PEZI|nr:hypothetical protein BT63DRAFT_459724 [Microthyrium microscopicum]